MNNWLLTSIFIPLLIFGYNSVKGDEIKSEEGYPPMTWVNSESLEMKSTPEQNLFYFSGNVRIIGNNLLVKCDYLEVTTNRTGDAEATIGQIGIIKKIIAIGSVKIFQAGRAATAGHAELLPDDNMIVLTDSPQIIDQKATVSGWRITLMKGKRMAIVESNPDDLSDGRPTVVLDALPDLGFSDENEENAENEVINNE